MNTNQIQGVRVDVIAPTPGCEFCELKRDGGHYYGCQQKAKISAARSKMINIPSWKKLRLAELGEMINAKMKNAPHLHIDELYTLYKEAIELCDNDDILAGMMLDLCEDQHRILKGCGRISKKIKD